MVSKQKQQTLISRSMTHARAQTGRQPVSKAAQMSAKTAATGRTENHVSMHSTVQVKQAAEEV